MSFIKIISSYNQYCLGKIIETTKPLIVKPHSDGYNYTVIEGYEVGVNHRWERYLVVYKYKILSQFQEAKLRKKIADKNWKDFKTTMNWSD